MFLSLLFCLSAFAADLKLGELEPKLDAFVKDFQPVENTGIAVGVVKDGELVFFKGYGYRDREKKLPVTEHTVFAIGSATKTFVSTSLAMLQEEGRVDFNAPIRNYLPGFALISADATSQANLNDLLSHQVGLPRHDLLWYLTPFSTPDLFSKLKYLEMDKNPGMGFRSGKMQYNNLMFMTAGIVLEKMSGQSWQQFVADRLLRPLGMKETSFTVTGFDREDAALPYAKETLLPYKGLDSVSAAGSINSTVSDLAKWVSFHLNAGQGLMKPASLAQLSVRRSDASNPERGMDLGYGLGMMLTAVGDKVVSYHGGNIDGFSAFVSFLPEAGLGVIVLVNQNGAANFQYPMAVKQGDQTIALFPRIIYDHFLGLPAKPALGSLDDLRETFADLRLPELSMPPASQVFGLIGAASGGNLTHPAYGTISLVNDFEGNLSLNYYGNIFPLAATGEAGKYESSGMPVEIEREGERLMAISVGFEPAVKPIRFVAQ
jgi:CubicO group peptidase (beta-lactamase class C family)